MIVRPRCPSCVWSEACGGSLSATDRNAKSLSISPTLTGCRTEQWEQKLEFAINIPALSRFVDAKVWRNLSHDHYVNTLAEVPQYSWNLYPNARDLGVHEAFEFSVDIDEAAGQLREDLELSPLRLDDITRAPQSDWLTFMPVSIGISLSLSAIGIGIYCLHRKGCLKLKLKLTKSQPDVEKAEIDENAQQCVVFCMNTQMKQGTQVPYLRDLLHPGNWTTFTPRFQLNMLMQKPPLHPCKGARLKPPIKEGAGIFTTQGLELIQHVAM